LQAQCWKGNADFRIADHYSSLPSDFCAWPRKILLFTHGVLGHLMGIAGAPCQFVSLVTMWRRDEEYSRKSICLSVSWPTWGIGVTRRVQQRLSPYIASRLFYFIFNFITIVISATQNQKNLQISVAKVFTGKLVTDYVTCATITGSAYLRGGTVYYYFCIKRAVGRYVVYMMNRPSNAILPLRLCELEVYGDLPYGKQGVHQHVDR
jgi:hypothetical protein